MRYLTSRSELKKILLDHKVIHTVGIVGWKVGWRSSNTKVEGHQKLDLKVIKAFDDLQLKLLMTFSPLVRTVFWNCIYPQRLACLIKISADDILKCCFHFSQKIDFVISGKLSPYMKYQFIENVIKKKKKKKKAKYHQFVVCWIWQESGKRVVKVNIPTNGPQQRCRHIFKCSGVVWKGSGLIRV